MSNSIIIDRRRNPKGKSSANRKRFLEKVRDSIQESESEIQKKKDISDKTDVDIRVSKKGILEPEFTYDRNSGTWDSILPGNKEYVPGDTIDKSKTGSGVRGSEAGEGEGEDDFKFTVSRDEYIDIILENLDLPDMVKLSLSQKSINSTSKVRAGYTSVGQESNLNIVKTLITYIGRRISLRDSRQEEIEELLNLLNEEKDEIKHKVILEQIEELKSKLTRGYIENVDLRYNNFKTILKPKTDAVVFFIMDVSGSMNEKRKLIAKRFFLLLFMFLKRRHKDISVIFIAHTELANEVTEEEFFYSTATGGTKISAAFELTRDIIDKRYNVAETNIYLAQATDGDNFSSDNEEVMRIISELLPSIQYMTYLEVSDSIGFSEVWRAMLQKSFEKVAMQKVKEENEIIPAFRSMFKKRSTTR